MAVKQVVPLAEARFGDRGLDIAVAGLRISPGRVHGEVASDGERIAFDLRFTMNAAPLVPFPSARMYEARLPSSKLVSPHPDSRFEGSYTVAGETVEVARLARHAGSQLGYATRRALRVEPLQPVGGPRRSRPRGCHRTREGRAGARAAALDRVRPSSRRPVRLQRAAHARPRTRARSSCAAGRSLRRTRSRRSPASSGQTPSDFVGLSYENPDGAITYCLNSKIARGRIRLSVRGRPDIEALTRAAALEIGTKDPAHGVTMLA